MKAKVYVTLKPSVLDPQGKAIHHSVELLGFENDRRHPAGQIFRNRFDRKSFAKPKLQTAVEKIAKDVLANPVIEDYKVEIDELGCFVFGLNFCYSNFTD